MVSDLNALAACGRKEVLTQVGKEPHARLICTASDLDKRPECRRCDYSNLPIESEVIYSLRPISTPPGRGGDIQEAGEIS